MSACSVTPDRACAKARDINHGICGCCLPLCGYVMVVPIRRSMDRAGYGDGSPLGDGDGVGVGVGLGGVGFSVTDGFGVKDGDGFGLTV